jgi:uncharacterized protein (TIGR02145 family)
VSAVRGPYPAKYLSSIYKGMLFTAAIAGLLLSGALSCALSPLVDVDGNAYPTVKIGKQVWIAENFRATKLNDGTSLQFAPDSLAWHRLSAPGYCFYGNTTNADTLKMLGALYNWYAVGSGKLAPRGWHVATNEDWATLRSWLIDHGYNWDGDRKKDENKIAKALAAQSGWKPYPLLEGMPGNDQRSNNRSGFSGQAAGYRFDQRDSLPGKPPVATYTAIHHRGAWWSATAINDSFAYAYGLGFCREHLIEYDSYTKNCGYSVRLVKDR